METHNTRENYVYDGTEILVVLDGRPLNIPQMYDNINYLNSIGLHNIVVSTYSKFIPGVGSSNVHFPCSYVRIDKKNGNSPYYRDLLNQLSFCYPGYIDMENFDSNVNIQIYSTLEGIKKGYTQEMEFDYILKCRVDYQLYNKNNWITKALKDLKKIPYNTEDIFNKKVILQSPEEWYYDDLFFFGTKEDIFRLFNIPFKSNNKAAGNYLATAYPKSQGYNSSWKTFKKNYILDASKYNVEGVLHDIEPKNLI
jgi:hypothetical protein